MGSRYWISGAQLGMIKGFVAVMDKQHEVEKEYEKLEHRGYCPVEEMVEQINEVVDSVIEGQWIGEADVFDRLLASINVDITELPDKGEETNK